MSMMCSSLGVKRCALPVCVHAACVCVCVSAQAAFLCPEQQRWLLFLMNSVWGFSDFPALFFFPSA